MQRRTLFTLATASTLAASAVTGGALAADNTDTGSSSDLIDPARVSFAGGMP